MILIDTAIEIAATREHVWRVLTDFAAYAAWNPYLIAVEGKARAGTTLSVTSVPVVGGPSMTQPVELVSLDEPREMRWAGGMPDRTQFSGDHRWTLAARDGGTSVRHFEYFDGAMAAAILGQHGETIRAAFERFNVALKARCEA